MKYLGLDVGNKRIGVAFGDSDLRLATPVDVIMRGSLEQDAQVLANLVREYDAAQLIVGLPRNMDNSQGEQAEAVIEYAQTIAERILVPIVFWDERLTTVEATKRAHETGARGKKSRRGIDALAAAVLLQDYLDSQADETH